MPYILLPGGMKVECDTVDEAVEFVKGWNAIMEREKREAAILGNLKDEVRWVKKWERLYRAEYWYPYLRSKTS